MNMFSDSVHITIEDIHFILGPNITSGSKDSDFKDHNSPYDLNDIVKNLKRMFAQVDQEELEDEEIEKKLELAGKIQNAE